MIHKQLRINILGVVFISVNKVCPFCRTEREQLLQKGFDGTVVIGVGMGNGAKHKRLIN